MSKLRAMNRVIEISNLSFAYQDENILDNLNFIANKGEFIAIVGDNGVGKSTLMNLILRNVKASSGEIRLFGELIEKNNHYEDIAYISQNSVMGYRNFPTTIEEVIKIHLRYLKKKVEIDKYIKIVGLEEHSKKTLSELSGGQLQRVGLLLALIKDAELILLDEPTAGVDKKFSIELLKLLREFSSKGKTVVMVTHHLLEMKDFADRTVLIENGMCKEVQGGAIYA